MKNQSNFIQGVNGQYSFYVIAFDSQNHFADVNEHIDLTLKQAQEIYSKVILKNPKHVNTILGVVYVTDKMELDRYGKGSVDLLQCIDGKIKLCEDYKHSALLSTEEFIINTINILSRKLNEWQEKLNMQNKSDLQKQTQSKNSHGKVSICSSLKDIQNDLNKSNSVSRNQQIL